MRCAPPASAGRRARSLPATRLLLLALLAACSRGHPPPPGDVELPTPRPEALSLLARPLYRVPLPPDRAAALEAQLDTAWRYLSANPGDAAASLRVAQRLTELGRQRDALIVLDEALQRHSDHPALLRARADRYVATRQLHLAGEDLERALEMLGMAGSGAHEMAGALHETRMRLGFVRYLQRDFSRAAESWREALALAEGAAARVLVTDWLYLALAHAGRNEEAERLLEEVPPDVAWLPHRWHRRRLLLYRGDLPPDSLLAAAARDPAAAATYRFGVASWEVLRGDTATALRLLRRILQQPDWTGLDYIAAEAELAARR